MCGQFAILFDVIAPTGYTAHAFGNDEGAYSSQVRTCIARLPNLVLTISSSTSRLFLHVPASTTGFHPALYIASLFHRFDIPLQSPLPRPATASAKTPPLSSTASSRKFPRSLLAALAGGLRAEISSVEELICTHILLEVIMIVFGQMHSVVEMSPGIICLNRCIWGEKRSKVIATTDSE